MSCACLFVFALWSPAGKGLSFVVSNCEFVTFHWYPGSGVVLVGPTGVYLLDFFCSGIQFNLLLSPYPCFISLLYLDLYVLGDDALIS